MPQGRKSGGVDQRSGEERIETRNRLRQEVEQAKQEYEAADALFNKVTAAPTGLPHPDGVYLIKYLSKQRILAFEKYVRLEERYARYLMDGGLPPE